MLKRTKMRMAAVGAVVLTLAVVGTATANADPTTTFPETTFQPVVGVGSDTIQDVMNGLSSAIKGGTTGIGSYDATAPLADSDTTTIQTTSGGPFFVRPNGSGAGIQALSDATEGGSHTWNGVNISGQVQFARSSSSAASIGVSGTDLTYIPFAKDAVTYAVNEASDFPRDIPEGSAAAAAANPTALTLWNIYHCTATTYVDSNANTVTIIPLVPQAGSGTRKFWDSTFGLTEGANYPSCITDNNGTVEEHDGNALVNPGDIMPFSISQFIAQGNWQNLPSVVQERRFAAQLGSVDGITPYIISGNTVVQNPSFEISRLVYDVVPTAAITTGSPTLNPALVTDFVGTSSLVCSNAAIIKEYGFATIGSQCGSTTSTGGFTQ